jgi:restriction system protein
MNNNDVNDAFKILLDEIERVFNMISKEGEEAFKNQDFDKAKSLSEYGEQLKSFREKVRALQHEWQKIFNKNISIKEKKKHIKNEQQKIFKKTPIRVRKRKIRNSLKRGLRTPVKKFIMPILESLIELGGKAKMKDILNLVHDKMKDTLNEYDYAPLPSHPNEKRWENTAQWARYIMVQEGLLANDSPQGIWEITEKGKIFYEENK